MRKLLSECNAHAFSAVVPTRFSERQTARLSSALPGQRNEAVSLVRRIGTDCASGRPSVSGVSAANAARERSARCNANRFEELACVLTPSNKEGGTDDAFCEDQTATESFFQLMLVHSAEGVFWKRRSLR